MATKKSAKKTKPKKRVLSKTEVSYKNKQYRISRKLGENLKLYNELISESNQSKKIDFEGKKTKIRTAVNKVLRRANKLGNELDAVTKKRVRLTRGKYTPKSKYTVDKKLTISKSDEKKFTQLKYKKWSVYNYWEFNDFQKDLLMFTNKRYTYFKVDPFEFGDIISEMVNELFFQLSVSSTEGSEYPVVVLYVNETEKDTKAFIYDASAIPDEQ